MSRRRNVEKSIVEEVKGNIMDTNKGLVLDVSYNDFILGANIDRYLDRDHSKTRISFGETEPDREDYYFIQEQIGVNCELDGTIAAIDCSTTCIYQGMELIGMYFTDFLELIHETPDSESIEYILVDGKGQNQHVYDFDFGKSGIQVWTWRKRIRAVIIYTY